MGEGNYADFDEGLEAAKAALVQEDNLRIRMAALEAAAKVAEGTATEPTIVDPGILAGGYVLRMAERFERYLKTGDVD